MNQPQPQTQQVYSTELSEAIIKAWIYYVGLPFHTLVRTRAFLSFSGLCERENKDNLAVAYVLSKRFY
jgi:hypothetical protein